MKNLLINKDYSVTSGSYTINLNAEDTIDINHLNMIASQLSIEEIKTVNDYFSKFKFCINAIDASKFLSKRKN